MFYTIYKITNKVNGKIYIGKHQTKDLNDGYMGSGKLIRAAIKKYGIDNFEKEILFQFDNESEMNAKEAELVTEDFVKEDTNYNLCYGGHGGFGYINSHILINDKRLEVNRKNLAKTRTRKSSEKRKETRDRNFTPEELSKKISTAVKNSDTFKEGIKRRGPTFKGKKHTEETKQKMRKTKNQGSKNSQYGTIWITNGIENKKIGKDTIIPNGWYKGRKIK